MCAWLVNCPKIEKDAFGGFPQIFLPGMLDGSTHGAINPLADAIAGAGLWYVILLHDDQPNSYSGWSDDHRSSKAPRLKKN